MNWKSFLIGLVVGVVLSLIALGAGGSRYKITKSGLLGQNTLKLDAWTGRSWQLAGGHWEEVK